MNRKYDYKDLDKWRRTKNRYKRKYFGKTAIYGLNNKFTEKECEMILRHDISDCELSKIIHHSVSSIQTKRWRLLNELREKSEIEINHSLN